MSFTLDRHGAIGQIQSGGWINVFDLQMLLNTLYFNYRKPDNDDVISFAIKSIAQKECFPSLVSTFTWRLLKKPKLLELVKSYWCGWRANCGMYELYKKKFEELG